MLSQLYEAIATTAGAPTVVDAGKLAWEGVQRRGQLLRLVEAGDLDYQLHDPARVA